MSSPIPSPFSSSSSSSGSTSSSSSSSGMTKTQLIQAMQQLQEQLTKMQAENQSLQINSVDILQQIQDNHDQQPQQQQQQQPPPPPQVSYPQKLQYMNTFSKLRTLTTFSGTQDEISS